MNYAAEIFDQVLLLFNHTGWNDHQLHCVLRFRSRLNARALEEAVVSSIEAIPILGTRYAGKGPRPRWESIDRARFGDAFATVHSEAGFDRFTTCRIDETAGPLVKVCLLDSDRPAVALTMSHMVSDAAGFKKYLYFLARTYSGIVANPGHRPTPPTGDRSMEGVLEDFGLGARIKSLLLQRKESNHCGKRRFPYGSGGDEKPFILARKLGRNDFETVRDYCEPRGASVNDVLLAAYYRCMFRRLGLSCGKELRIPLMVDMRRYLGESAKSDVPANLTSMLVTRLRHRPEEDFASTLARVKALMDRSKAGNIGLSGFLKLDLLYRCFPDRMASFWLKPFLDNPLISMTNIGLLDHAGMSFAGLRPHDAFMTGSIQHKPHFQVAVSTYDGEVTFSSDLYGSADDRERVSSFLEELERELVSECSSVESELDCVAA